MTLVPVRGKSSVCLICMKYRIILLIIIIIRLGQILLLYIANTSRTHARTHARTRERTHARTRVRTHPRERVHTPPHTHRRRRIAIRFVCASQPWRPAPLVTIAGRPAIEINTGTGGPVSPRFWVFFAYKKMLGRTDTRTGERMYCQTIRTIEQ